METKFYAKKFASGEDEFDVTMWINENKLVGKVISITTRCVVTAGYSHNIITVWYEHHTQIY